MNAHERGSYSPKRAGGVRPQPSPGCAFGLFVFCRIVTLLLAASPSLRAQSAAPDTRPPDVYRLPFIIPGAVLDRDMPTDREHWIPKPVAMRFGKNHLLFDAETCAVRGWWRSGDERITSMTWGSRVVFIPDAPSQTAEAGGARFEWGRRDAAGTPPLARFAGYRIAQDSAVEITWTSGEGPAALTVTETFRRRDGAWWGFAVSGVTRTLHASAVNPPGMAAVLGGRFRSARHAPLALVTAFGSQRIEPDGSAIPLPRDAALPLLQGPTAVTVLDLHAPEGATAELTCTRPSDDGWAVDVRWRLTPTDRAATTLKIEMAYIRLLTDGAALRPAPEEGPK